MELKPLHNPEHGQMRVVGLMSGSGSNIVKILEAERALEQQSGKEAPYKMVALFTDNPQSNAKQIGTQFDLPVITSDIKTFYKDRGKPRRDMGLRAEYDAMTVELLAPYAATVAAYGGYMSIATAPLIEAFLGVNVHPADLTTIGIDGKRAYTGDNAVRDAILAGEQDIYSTMHIVEPEVDAGRILMVSGPVPVEFEGVLDPADKDLVARVADANQERLKVEGDWKIFPKTLLYLAQGRILENEATGELYFDGVQPIPKGVFDYSP